jgi:Protein of unknown function (DUF2815)
MKLVLKNVRLAFAEIFAAKAVNGEGEPAYSASFLIDPKDKQIAAIEKMIEEVGKEKWAAKWPAVKKELTAKDKLCLHDGDTKTQYAGFEGMMFVSARNKKRTDVRDRDKTPLTAEDGKPYSGCYVNAVVDVWAQDNAYGKRVNASLLGVQFVKDGEAFSGGATATDDDYEELGDDADSMV